MMDETTGSLTSSLASSQGSSSSASMKEKSLKNLMATQQGQIHQQQEKVDASIAQTGKGTCSTSSPARTKQMNTTSLLFPPKRAVVSLRSVLYE